MNHLYEYGFDSEYYKEELKDAPSGAVPARVVSVHRARFGVAGEEGEGFAQVKGSAYRDQKAADYLTVGDFVLMRPAPGGDGQILRTLPRKSLFARADGFGPRGVQAVAANIDYAFIVTSLNRDFNIRRLERYLAQTLESGAKPVILLTKEDLCADPAEYVRRAEAVACGAPVHAISALTGAGLEELAPYMKPGVTLALLGMSGVGKSSLLNALAGENLMRVNETRAVDSAKGRHTTTHRQLLRLPCGALVIDTPGMREFGVWDAETGVTEVFEDIEELAASCRFSDCRHENEPGCAVRAALENGSLDAGRLRNYLALRGQARATARVKRERQGKR